MIETAFRTACLTANCRYGDEFDGPRVADRAVAAVLAHAKAFPGHKARVIVDVWQRGKEKR